MTTENTTQTTTTTNTPWHASLPDDLKTNPNVTKFESPEALARSYVSASHLIGKKPEDLIEVPKDDAGRLAAWRRLGAADKPDAYKINFAADAPESVKGLVPVLAKVAAEKGLHPSHVQAVAEALAGHAKQGATDEATKRDAKHTENINALKTRLGAGFDNHVKLANAGLAKAGEKLGEGGAARLHDKLKDAGLATDPDVLDALALLGSLTAEDDSGAARGGESDGNNGGFGSGTPSAHEAKALDYQRQAMNSKDQFERRRLNDLAEKEWAAAAAGK